MLINRINANLLNIPQKELGNNQSIKFIDVNNNEESKYDFENDIVIINLDHVHEIEKRTNISQSIIIEYLFFHEIGHKNDPYWRMVHSSNRSYETLDKEILESALLRYLKIEQFANDFAKYHRPSYINKEYWEILFNDYSDTLNENCKIQREELERSIKYRKILPKLCIPIKFEFSDEDIDEIKKKFKISIEEKEIPEIKILKCRNPNQLVPLKFPSSDTINILIN